MDEKSASVWIQLIQSLTKLAIIAVICTCVYLSVQELAGKSTRAIFDASMAYSNGVNGWLMTVAVALFLYAMGERKFREHKIRYMTKRIKDLETDMDPERSSSGLPSTGNTRPEDK